MSIFRWRIYLKKIFILFLVVFISTFNLHSIVIVPAVSHQHFGEVVFIESHYNSDVRVRTVSVRLLEFHADYAEMFANAIKEKALGNDEKAQKLFNEMRIECGKREIEFERWFDHCQTFNYLTSLANSKTSAGDSESIASN
jgi:hypothetical protein